MVLIVHRKQLYKKQYGFGFKYYKPIRGGSIFSVIKKGLSFIYNKVLKPLWKNNKSDIIQGAVSGVSNLVSKHDKPPPLSAYKEEIISPILNKMIDKPLSEHLKGDGLNSKSKKILKRLAIYQ